MSEESRKQSTGVRRTICRAISLHMARARRGDGTNLIMLSDWLLCRWRHVQQTRPCAAAATRLRTSCRRLHPKRGTSLCALATDGALISPILLSIGTTTISLNLYLYPTFPTGPKYNQPMSVPKPLLPYSYII